MVVYSNLNQDRVQERRSFIKKAIATSIIAPSAGSVLFSDGSQRSEAAPSVDVSSAESSPYGICAHVGGGEEWSQAPKNFEVMKKAGIRWVRADFSWIGVENPQGKWHFDHLDAIIDKAEQVGIQILPILDYDVPWAIPSYKHMDEWIEYVKQLVTRYKDRIKYWEVWNEENLKGFWHDEPNPEEYAKFLKTSYETIKEIDPNLVVLYGGLAGVPVDFFEKSLDAGAGNFFDVVNIHPYRGGLTTRDRIDRFQSDIRAFSNALVTRGLAPRPIWITEMGWATPPIFGDVNRRVVAAAIQRLFPDTLPSVAFFYDERYEPSSSRPSNDFYSYLPDDYNARHDLVSFVDADQLKKNGKKEFDVLVMPPSETFPSDCFAEVAKFVKDGGVLVLNGGVPLYYASNLDPETGKYRQAPNNPNFVKEAEALRISWFAWWTRENVPEQLRAVVASESVDFKPTRGKNALDGFFPVHQATRFFDDKALKPGDKMISLLDGRSEEFCASSACIYDFNSDYQGAVVVNSVADHDGTNTNVATPANQAIFLPQSYLLAFATGIERYFWYEFQAMERDEKDPEHHFGIVHQQLDPKPAYHAYAAMTKARPAGSGECKLALDDDDVVVSWNRPDGKKGWAIWTSRTPKEKTLRIQGQVENSFDYLGNDITKPSNGTKIMLSPGIVYLIGPSALSLE